MISTLRRIGEELYSCKAPSSEDSVVKGCDDLKRGKFLRHKNLQIRILSYLIILLSLSQGQCCAAPRYPLYFWSVLAFTVFSPVKLPHTLELLFVFLIDLVLRDSEIYIYFF